MKRLFSRQRIMVGLALSVLALLIAALFVPAAGVVALLLSLLGVIIRFVPMRMFHPRNYDHLRLAIHADKPPEDWIRGAARRIPDNPEEVRLRRRQKLVYIGVLLIVIVDVCIVVALYFISNTDATALEAAPIILLFTWALLGLYRLLWAVINSRNAAMAARAEIDEMRWQFERPRQHLFDPGTPMIALFLVEIGLLLVLAYAATEHYLGTPATWALNGIEAEWLTSYVYQAFYAVRDEGYISLWNPWFEWGEPLLANPFSFILNPFSTLPGLLEGGERGILLSIVIYAMVAGVGGWYLGRVLGMSSFGRVLLGVLMIGKGTMHGNIGPGYFQLGVSQAWIPWAIAGFLACAYYPQKRWPAVLTAVSLALMFWAGNIWHTLPTIMSFGFLAIVHSIDINGRRYDFRIYRQWAFAGVLTLGLTAITLVPIWMYQDRIGAHPDFALYREQANLYQILLTLWESDPQPYYDFVSLGPPHFYFSYISPPWMLLLLFVVLPPIWPLTYRATLPTTWRIWFSGAILSTLFILWASGDNWFWLELYDRIDLLRQWRFVGRALAMGTFWLVVLMALRVDGLIRAIFQPITFQTWRSTLTFLVPQGLLLMAVVIVMMRGAGATLEPWTHFGWAAEPRRFDHACTEWLRARYPDEELAVFRPKYDATTAFMDNRIRLMPIEADFEIIPDESTIGRVNFLDSLPRFAFGWNENERAAITGIGYVMMEESPTIADIDPRIPIDDIHCVYHQSPTYSYAFTVPMYHFEKRYQKLDPSTSTPIANIDRDTDDIRLVIDHRRHGETVVVVQEIAYPGWQAYINGKQVEYESVGGFLGVVIPGGTDDYVVEFRFRPQMTYNMAWVSLGTIAFTILYLLRTDKMALAAWQLNRRRRAKTLADAPDAPVDAAPQPEPPAGQQEDGNTQT